MNNIFEYLASDEIEKIEETIHNNEKLLKNVLTRITLKIIYWIHN